MVSSESRLAGLKTQCSQCRACGLYKGRTKAVFGHGNNHAELMFVGEAPGADEDLKGLPFVGKAGKLLTKMIEAMGLTREEVYITNVVKSRPPNNRTPTDWEMERCGSLYLDEEIKLIQPKIIVTLGSTATQFILRTDKSISKLRGKFHLIEFFQVMPTFHPAYLLRNPSEKGKVWHDLQMVMDKLGLIDPEA